VKDDALSDDDRAPLATAPHRVGPFDITQDRDSLILRFEDRGEVTMRGCLFFACLGVFVLMLGLLALIEAASAPAQTLTAHNPSNPAQLLGPTENHFGILWGIGVVGVVIGVPLYNRSLYHSSLIYTFRRSDDVLLRGSYRITRLRQIEYLTIRESQDPDDRYIYILDIVYGDGRHLEMHRGYEEREIMNLANEISAFTARRVIWRDT